MKKGRRITITLFIIYMVVLSWAILFKFQFSIDVLGHMRRVNLIPFAESAIVNGKIDFDEIINNVIAFIPVGIYLGMMKTDWSFLKKLSTIAGISLLYEITQFVFAIGATDITDLIDNTLGGIIGILVFMFLYKVFKEKIFRILNALATICTVSLLSLILCLIITEYML